MKKLLTIILISLAVGVKGQTVIDTSVYPQLKIDSGFVYDLHGTGDLKNLEDYYREDTMYIDLSEPLYYFTDYSRTLIIIDTAAFNKSLYDQIVELRKQLAEETAHKIYWLRAWSELFSEPKRKK